MSANAVITAVLGAATFVKTYGPLLKELGADISGLLGFIQKHKHHEALTEDERRDLNDTIAELESLGQTPPLEGPPPGPTSPPLEFPPPDPTSIEYDTKDDAIAATSPATPFVIQKSNGKFVVWPVVGPFPGTKVYPA